MLRLMPGSLTHQRGMAWAVLQFGHDGAALACPAPAYNGQVLHHGWDRADVQAPLALSPCGTNNVKTATANTNHVFVFIVISGYDCCSVIRRPNGKTFRYVRFGAIKIFLIIQQSVQVQVEAGHPVGDRH